MIYKRILLPHIDRKDIEALEKRLKALGDDKEFTLMVDEIEYQSIAEVSPNQHKANKVQLTTQNPFVTINFSDAESYLIAANDVNETTLGEIVEILNNNQRVYLWHGAAIMPFLVTAFIGLVMVLASANFVLELDTREQNIFFIITVFTGFFVILLTSFLLRVRLHHFSQITLNNQNNSFVYRYRKQIGFAVFSGLVGAVAGTVLTVVIDLLLR